MKRLVWFAAAFLAMAAGLYLGVVGLILLTLPGTRNPETGEVWTPGQGAPLAAAVGIGRVIVSVLAYRQARGSASHGRSN